MWDKWDRELEEDYTPSTTFVRSESLKALPETPITTQGTSQITVKNYVADLLDVVFDGSKYPGS